MQFCTEILMIAAVIYCPGSCCIPMLERPLLSLLRYFHADVSFQMSPTELLFISYCGSKIKMKPCFIMLLMFIFICISIYP